MSGDALASGAKSANFRTGGGKLSEIAYDLRVLSKAEFQAKYPEQDYDRLIADMSKIKPHTGNPFAAAAGMRESVSITANPLIVYTEDNPK